jgi:hypothetical protein
MGEGWDGRRLREPLARRGVDIVDIPPHLNPPPPWGEEVVFLTQLGYKLKIESHHEWTKLEL